MMSSLSLDQKKYVNSALKERCYHFLSATLSIETHTKIDCFGLHADKHCRAKHTQEIWTEEGEEGADGNSLLPGSSASVEHVKNGSTITSMCFIRRDNTCLLLATLDIS